LTALKIRSLCIKKEKKVREIRYINNVNNYNNNKIQT
jgi:hypothetical protein